MATNMAPNLSNADWDVLFVRSVLLPNCYTIRLLSLLTERFLINFADIIFSLLANLIGQTYKRKVDKVNIHWMVKLLSDVNWIPNIAQ